MSTTPGPTATIDDALARASQMLARRPDLADEQAGEVLRVAPGHPLALLIQGAARRITGRTDDAIQILEPLSVSQAHAAPVWLELGIALAEAGQGPRAVAALKRATQLAPAAPDGWRYLADQLDAAGEAVAADTARARYLGTASRDPALVAAAAALVANDLPAAEARLITHLSTHPTDVAALRMRAEIAARLRQYRDAERLLEQCLALAPSFDAARHNYAVVLNRQGKAAQALPEVERLLAREPRNPGYRNLKAAILAHIGEYSESIDTYEAVLREFPDQPKVWMSYGHALKTDGRHEGAVAAYREAIRREPSLGEAYWSLANLKTFRFTPADVASMRGQLGRDGLVAEDRLHFEFALGKALEDEGAFEESFVHYAAGNAQRLALHPYSAEEHSAYVRRNQSLFTRAFFAEHRDVGDPRPDPIFIVGLPRAGSTLIEQILASHPRVEGTMELPELPQLATELAGRAAQAGSGSGFEGLVASLTAEEWAALGARYLEATRVYRKTEAPFFIDKMPNNCLHVGLIALMLPNAKIIDARRHPLGCCFSAFKQHFARGQSFSYSLGDVGRYYRDYVELMAHFDAVLPGRVHRVHYETMVEDTEAEVRRLLDYCGLGFDERCLRFYENDRAVRTASSEQVRKPIFRDGIDQWRHFEPWLAPLKSALGTVLDCYPQVPQDFDK